METTRLRLTAVVVASVCAAALWQTAGAAGDAQRGKTLFAVCETCHGPDAKGLQEMNAPALAGREEWYLRRQLENFKSGARGVDERDIYGRQMAPMAQLLADKQAIDDVLAYLSSLD